MWKQAAFAGLGSVVGGALLSILGAFLADFGLISQKIPDFGAGVVYAGMGLCFTSIWPGNPDKNTSRR